MEQEKLLHSYLEKEKMGQTFFSGKIKGHSYLELEKCELHLFRDRKNWIPAIQSLKRLVYSSLEQENSG